MLNIKDKSLSIPLIQGGMGVGVSLGNLAGNVAKKGGMGIISTAHPGYREKDFYTNTKEANIRALDQEIKKAKDIAQGNGMIGVNIMVAINDYEMMVKQSIASGADVIISGAGLPLSLPQYTKDTNIAIAPIVSSGRSAKIILRTWDKRYQVIPDFIVIEGSLAGGHLGFSKEDVLENKTQTLEEILKDVIDIKQTYENKYNQTIPVFVAGGIFDGYDMAHFMKLGAHGVQMATRFIATYECDADEKFKQMIVNCKKEDIQIVQSPVGMPGRAMCTPLIQKVGEGQKIPLTHCFKCLKPCDPKNTPYCISMALIHAVSGNINQGLVFCGTNACRIKEMRHVSNLIDEIMKECEETL